MAKGTPTDWLAVLEKKGLYQVAWILENYGIDSETDVSLLDQGDLRKLVEQGLKPMQLKKLECWCDAVRPRAEKTLPSSLNTPTTACEGECDGDKDCGEEDDDDSENVLEIVLEQSGTADSTGVASGGTEARAKKAKLTLTEDEKIFAKKFLPAASKIDKERKKALRHVTGRGSSVKRQGARKHDVKPETMK